MSVGISILLIFFIIFLLPSLLLHLQHNKKKYQKLPKGRMYAGFWVRFGAGLSDTVILAFTQFILEKIFFGSSFGESTGVLLFSIVVSWCYFCLFQNSKYQATPGMMLCKIRIFDNNFKKVTLGRLTLRYFAFSLSAFILCIGLFMIGWTKRKQALHDIFAKTIHLHR